MKKKYFSVIFIIMSTLVFSGCGDSKIREIRGKFIDGCKSGGVKKDVCVCLFDKMQDKYTRDQLLDMKIGVVPSGFIEFSAQATLSCVREN